MFSPILVSDIRGAAYTRGGVLCVDVYGMWDAESDMLSKFDEELFDERMNRENIFFSYLIFLLFRLALKLCWIRFFTSNPRNLQHEESNWELYLYYFKDLDWRDWPETSRDKSLQSSYALEAVFKSPLLKAELRTAVQISLYCVFWAIQTVSVFGH